MSELHITGGFTTIDPLKEYLRHEALPQEQDSGVQDRCPEVLKEALTLCMWFGGLDMADTNSNPATNFRTPIINYDIMNGDRLEASGPLWLQAQLGTYEDARELTAYDLSQASISLHYLLDGKPKQLLWLNQRALHVYTVAGLRKGDHAMLNYTQGIVQKVREAAFPKDPKIEEERKRDREADTLRRQARRQAVDNRGRYL